MDVAFKTAGLTLAFVLYYRYAIRSVGELTRPPLRLVLNRLALARRYSTDEMECVMSLGVATLLQTAFFVAMLALTGVSLGALAPDGIQVTAVFYGIVLGVGEASFASFLGVVALNVGSLVADRRAEADQASWLLAGRAGWMRFFLRTVDVMPRPLMIVLPVLYIAVEESLFRGVVISWLHPHGAFLAAAVSTALFVLAQVFHMPSWRSAVFPVAGALCVGITHSALFLANPDIVPLIVAHSVFFLLSAL